MKWRDRVLAGAIAVGLLAGASTLAGPAEKTEAHTPAISASCTGVVLKASAYDGSKANTYSVTIGGVEQHGVFGASLNITIPVPQEAATTVWSATIQAFNGEYKQTKDGTVGPCGRTTVVIPSLEVTPPTCEADGTLPLLSWPAAQNPNGYEGKGFRVYLDRAYDGPGVYVVTIQRIGPGFDPDYPNGTTIVGETTQTLTVLPKLDPTKDPCFTEPEPQPEVTVKAVESIDCLTQLVNITTTTTTVGWTLQTEPIVAWVRTAPVDAVVVTTRPLSDKEAFDCAVAPEPIFTSTTGNSVDCETGIYTEWVEDFQSDPIWNPLTRAYDSFTEPYSIGYDEATRPATEVECPVVVVEEPPVGNPNTPARPLGQLIVTGVEETMVMVGLLSALGLVAAGSFLVWGMRRRRNS